MDNKKKRLMEIVDLGGMKQIIRIDRRNRMTLIEPGVTFGQIQPALSKEGLSLSTPLLPRANKSVVASLLEREPVILPRTQWSMLDPLRCLEVVWGDGTRLTTGEAGRPGGLEEEWEMGFAQVAPAGRDILPQERVEFQEKDITEMAQQLGLQLVSAVPGAGAAEMPDILLKPSREPYWKLACKGGSQGRHEGEGSLCQGQ